MSDYTATRALDRDSTATAVHRALPFVTATHSAFFLCVRVWK